MDLPPKSKTAYGRACRKSRLRRYEQLLRTRPRNTPKRLGGGSMPCPGAVGISGLQAGEDVNCTGSRTVSRRHPDPAWKARNL
jgi:hypothetical protein